MPLVYQEVKDSSGNMVGTGNIDSVYRYYYGPYKKFDQVENFSMNVNKQDLELFLKTLEIQEENVYWEIPEESCYLTINASKNEELNNPYKLGVIITEAGNYLFQELCYRESFIDHLGIDDGYGSKSKLRENDVCL